MKIICVCNINNMLFGLTRYLRDRDLDVELILLNNEQAHFHPRHDTFTYDYETYTRHVKWGAIDTFLITSVKTIRNDIGNPDFIIATDNAIPFLNKGGYHIDIIFPAGIDLIKKSKVHKIMPWYAKLINPSLYFFSKSYQKGFQNASCINVENTEPVYRNALLEIKSIEKAYYFGCPMVYSPPYHKDRLTSIQFNNPLHEILRKIRSANQLMIFNHNRLNWKSVKDGHYHNKGTDILIKGFAHFVIKYPKINSSLIMFENGYDVEATKELIEDLGIADSIYFLPLSSRKDLLLGLKIADFGSGQFFVGGLGGGTTWETLAIGKPLLHFLDENNASFSNFDSPFPFVNVRTSEEISCVLEDFINQPDKYRKIGEDAKQWYHRNFEKKSVDRWIELINVKDKNGYQGLKAFVQQKAREQREKYDEARAKATIA